MIQLNEIRLMPGYTTEDIRKILKKNRIPEEADWQLMKLSLDARKKEDLHYLASIGATWSAEDRFLQKNRNRHIVKAERFPYQMPSPGNQPMRHRPVVIGAGPAGLFAAGCLAEAGYAPILLERGAPVEERTEDVRRFWQGGELQEDSNVQFGEGGAGTFSDGKLNTQIKDRYGRIRKVLEWFVEAGADPSILWWNKPHVGTDVLYTVVQNLRKRILAAGGEIWFHTKMTDLETDPEGKQITGVICEDAQGNVRVLPAETVILAIGHSARDTFSMLQKNGIPMHAKSFAVGVRIEHPQEMIQISQYGTSERNGLPVADYKLTGRSPSGRGVYSFCMCPGGQVVNASSEPGKIAVNGMSRAARDGRNANSALVVTVSPEDFGSGDSLAGVAFQRRLEAAAFTAGNGNIPVQLWEDFRLGRVSRATGDVQPDLCGSWELSDLREVLPEAVNEALLSQIPEFGKKIRGYDRPDAVLSGVESRTSSPVRIERKEEMESAVRGLYPCGEGAGYAGGITSAAVDGIKIAEAIIRRYRPWT